MAPKIAAITKKQAKILLRASTQLASLTNNTKAEALFIIVKSLSDYKGLIRDKG